MISPSTEEAVIVADPTVTAVTTPFSTVATDGLFDCHMTVLSVALLGRTVGTIVFWLPGSIDRLVGLSEIELTFISGSL